MKLRILFKPLPLTLLALLSFVTLNAQTEKPSPSKDARANMAERRQSNADELAKELNLSDEQKAKLNKIDEDFAAKAKASREARKENAQQLREERIKAYKSVMTPEQAAKYDEYREKKKAEHKQKSQQRQEKRANKPRGKAAPQRQ